MHEPDQSSPVVYGGLLIAGGQIGNVEAFDVKTGAMVWQQSIGGSIMMTPTIDTATNTLFIGNRFNDSTGKPAPSYLYALDLMSGAVRWSHRTLGLTHGSPVVAAGRVYAESSGGDAPGCRSTGVSAFDEATGHLYWNWFVDTNPNQGGSVWSPISYDGTHLYFGTGNTCDAPITTANGAAALNTNGTLAWSYVATRNSKVDDDTGGGVLVARDRAFFINKNGTFYALSSSGSFQWSNMLGAIDGAGMFSTPSTDGNVIIVGAGYTALPTAQSIRSLSRNGATNGTPVPFTGTPGTTKVVAMDYYGNVKWTLSRSQPLYGSAAINNGVAFAAIENELLALDVQSGKVLWSFTAPSQFRASPVVVPSGVYAVDTTGDVYAFAVPR